MYRIREIEMADKKEIKERLINNWGSDFMISKGKSYNLLECKGFVAIEGLKKLGLVIYRIDDFECEILVLDSFVENIGIGSTLITKVEEEVKKREMTKLWLITTNDNTRALKFYQKRDYDIVAIHRNAVTEARKLKPEIPLIGCDGIPMKHDIELEKEI